MFVESFFKNDDYTLKLENLKHKEKFFLGF